VRHALLQLGLAPQEIHRYMDAVREDHYNFQVDTEDEHRLLHELIHAIKSIEITWFRLPADNPLIGQTLEQANLRARTGASVVAILRDSELIANPKSNTTFQAQDRIGLIGEKEQIEAVETLFAATGSVFLSEDNAK
ncbi:MAG TPA: TrkA C-terminal domain-containing protein, partial [Anaerolineales bacterium]|nr:TrkA C-terminal domain-containing protein [Anaerolineales bacterium]